MLFSRETRRKLSALRRKHQTQRAPESHEDQGDPAVDPEATGETSDPSEWESMPGRPMTVEELFPGNELDSDFGCCYCIRADLSDLGEWLDRIAEGLRRHAPGELAFLDIETMGLSSLPVFLVGILRYENEGLGLDQLLARDLTEEAALLTQTMQALRHVEVLATYNGAAFDLPYLQSRAIYHGLDWRLPVEHLDLLRPARRRFRGRLPDCSLQTLECFLCGRERENDIPGAYIPDRYREFLQSGDARLLEVIVRHNQLDLLTLAEIVPHCLG